MKKIETLREQLYEAIDKGNKSEILSVSERLDKEIVKMMKKTKDFRQLFSPKKTNEKYKYLKFDCTV